MIVSKLTPEAEKALLWLALSNKERFERGKRGEVFDNKDGYLVLELCEYLRVNVIQPREAVAGMAVASRNDGKVYALSLTDAGKEAARILRHPSP